MNSTVILKGNILYTPRPSEFISIQHGYIIAVDGIVVYCGESIPPAYADCEVTDYGDNLIIPGFVDTHAHAPQYCNRGLGMDKELLPWLETYTFPEEAKFSDLDYARLVYSAFVQDLWRNGTTRSILFGTIHKESTLVLMELLQKAGLSAYVGKVNMDRNGTADLQEKSAVVSAGDTVRWLTDTAGKYENVKPILTPRFTPSCTDELMNALAELQRTYRLPVQSHLSENQSEIAWVHELCPNTSFYGEAYDQFGLFGSPDCPAIMAHCVYSSDAEIALMKKRGVFVAHCPQSNTNLSSGIAPVRRYLEEDLHIGLGTDIAGGHSLSMLRAIADAIQVSKLRWRLVDDSLKPLSLEEAFYMATMGGGAFFGKVGTFLEGYEFDALILDDRGLRHPQPLTARERLERLIYLSDDKCITGKYVSGNKIF